MRKFEKCLILGKLQKFPISKIPKISNVENYENFPNFTVSKIIEFLKFYTFKKANFQNLKIHKTMKIQ